MSGISTRSFNLEKILMFFSGLPHSSIHYLLIIVLVFKIMNFSILQCLMAYEHGTYVYSKHVINLLSFIAWLI